MDGELRRSVNLQVGIELADQRNEPEILNDHRVDTAVDRLTKKVQCLGELCRLHEDIQGQVDAAAASVCYAACVAELVESELRSLVTRVESLGTEVNGIRTVGDSGANGLEGAGGCEKFRN